MRRAGLILLLLLTTAAAAADVLHVEVHQTLTLQVPGATAAYAVAGDMAGVEASAGMVTVLGMAPGSTRLVVVADSGDLRYYDLVVDAPVATRANAGGQALRGESTSVESQYESDTTRWINAIDLLDRAPQRELRLHLVNVTRIGDPQDGSARTSFPSLGLTLSVPGHELGLFDELVYHSPLTLDGTPVRGVHYRTGALELHAGYTTATLFQNVFLPSDREAVAGASWRLAFGKSALTPGVYVFPSKSLTGGTRGALGSLLYTYGSDSDPLRILAELGVGHKAAGALKVSHDTASHRVWLEARYQPTGVASIGIGRPHGMFLDAGWTGTIGPRLAFALSESASRQQLPEFEPRSTASSGELRYFFARRWSANLGARLVTFESGRAGSSLSQIRTMTIPLGVSYDGPGFGFAALYRYQSTFGGNRSGSGGRLSARAVVGRFSAGAFVDAQRDVPTVDLIFREDPELARVFAELGLSAQTPEDVARILRENPALAQLGYIQGLSLSLDPWRVQAGADLVWSAADEAAHRVSLHVVLDRARTTRSLRDAGFATLSVSRKIASHVELSGGVTFWRSDISGAALGRTAFRIGLRASFDRATQLVPFLGRRVIRGIVFSDEGATGRWSQNAPPVVGARVRLDGERIAETDARGRFAFPGVSLQAHTVELLRPPEPEAYFTTPSRMSVDAGGEPAFGVAHLPARLTGFVRSDAGLGIAGVRLKLSDSSGSSNSFLAWTDSEGGYSFAVPPAGYNLEGEATSLPAGYDLSTLAPRVVLLQRDSPSRFDIVLRANRSISGTVVGKPSGRILVRIVELDREVLAGAEGEWLFRGLPPGTFTVTARVGDRVVSRMVSVPQGPSAIRGIQIGPDR